MIAVIKLTRCDGLLAETRRFRCAHRFSIGLRSGLFPDQSSTVTPCCSNQSLHIFAVWHGVPSCSKMKSGFSTLKMSFADDISFLSSTVSMYFFTLTFPSMIWSLPTPSRAMQPQIMTLTGCFVLVVQHSGRCASPILRRTY